MQANKLHTANNLERTACKYEHRVCVHNGNRHDAGMYKMPYGECFLSAGLFVWFEYFIDKLKNLKNLSLLSPTKGDHISIKSKSCISIIVKNETNETL